MSRPPKTSRMTTYLNYRLRITIGDGRQFVGQMLAFDRHMNLVLADTEEFRRLKKKGQDTEREEKRSLGLLILKGDTIVSISVESPPPPSREPKKTAKAGPGSGKSAGRGLPVAPVPAGLSGPVRGVGGPAPAAMAPASASAPAMPYARPPPGMPSLPPGMPPLPPGFRPPPGMPPLPPGFRPPMPPGFRPPGQ